MARGDPMTSPWIWTAADYLGRRIQISVAFNNSTFAITAGSTVFRDADCLYTKVYIGLGGDGTPETAQVFSVPAGTTNLPRSAFTSNGLSTIQDVLALNITAGP